MDTNVNEFKYSTLKKIICILICLATFLGATGLASIVLMSLDYCQDEMPAEFTESAKFKYQFENSIAYETSNALDQKVADKLKAEFEEHREAAVNSIYSQFKNIVYDEEYEYTYHSDLDTSISTSVSNFTFEFSPNYVYNYTDWRAFDEERIKEIINNSYDDFIDRASSNYLGNYGYYSFYNESNHILLYSELDGYSSSNRIEPPNENDIISCDYYYIYKNGEVTSKGINDNTVAYITQCLESYTMTRYGESFSPENATICAGFSLPLETIENPTPLEFFENYNEIQAMKDFHPIAVKTYNHFVSYCVWAVILLIISFVLAFRYLIVAGKRDKNTPAKLAFIDYIPFEIHLAISIALGAGATAILVGLIDNYYYSFAVGKPLLTLILVYAAVIWMLLFEFCASVARYAKSDKKFYKNFFVYQLVKLMIFIAKKLIKLDIKIIKAIGRGIKKSNNRIKKAFDILTYAPKKFARNVILIAILYVAENIAAIAIIAMFFAAYMEIIGVFLALADIGVNAYLFIKFLKYIKQLDMIITAAANHEDIAMDITTLPKSLRTLAESMRYTNAELQNAVAKAVKDERLRTELITNVSHDLKTPLTSIITYVDLLSKCDIQDEKAQEYIKVLGNRGDKLKRLIDDLIEASKVTSGNITVNLTNLNLYELCLQATVDTQSDFEKAGLELIVKENSDAPTIFADGPKSFRIIENLLSNARKYSARASRVYVNVYKENGMGVFEIKNVSAQPLDISPDELTERFVRGDKSRNQEGNGLGLSIAKELCKVQNGDLEIIIDGDLFKAKAKLPLAK
ncbi:MAG: HAMP domain-containing histidine kinase [Eubacterium sp.]|nr:HAMP domain-containing histidine kinase [Eubacterium sp.]MDE6766786.1 HAMP domain-containing histidine kinase [Eubacterium sp.]